MGNRNIKSKVIKTLYAHQVIAVLSPDVTMFSLMEMLPLEKSATLKG